MLHALLKRAPAWAYLIEGATIAICGPVNAGKSTLANRLLGADHSIVSPVPGTTRDWVAETTALHGVPTTIIDTAGTYAAPVRAASDQLESEAIARGRNRAAQADLRLLVLDRSDPESIVPAVWENALPTANARTIVVLNKSDLPAGTQARLDNGSGPVANVSAQTGAGIEYLNDLIVRELGLHEGRDDVPGLISLGQRRAVARILGDFAALACEPMIGDALAERITREFFIAERLPADTSIDRAGPGRQEVAVATSRPHVEVWPRSP